MSTKATFMTITICLMVRKAVELTWTTDLLSTTCCEGQDKILVWNYSREENDRIRQLQWYYNKTTLICYKSESYGFHVTPLYEGRVEKYGISGILLKHLSSNDTGEYTLYPKLSGEKFRNVQAIHLTVFEPPIYKCKPTIISHSKNVISCSTSSCGGQHLLQEWRLEGMQDPVGNESYLILNSSWTSKLVFCCPYEPRMECLNVNKFEFCTPNLIPSTTDANPAKEDINKEDLIEMPNEKAPNKRDTGNFGLVHMPLIIVSVLLLVTIMTLVALLVVWYSRTRRMSVKAKPTDAKVAKECNVELAPLQTVREPTDGHSSESCRNQHIQIVNNINMDSDIFRGMFNSNTALKTELTVLKEDLTLEPSLMKLTPDSLENRKLQNLLYRHKCSIQLQEKKELNDESSELTRVDAFDSSDSDTELFTLSVYKDAITDII